MSEKNRLKQFFENKKRLALICLALLVFLSSPVAFIANYLVADNLEPLDKAALCGRLLVIAPHCDDETIGCYNLMQTVLENGGEVMVVLLTNGDGRNLAIRLFARKLFPSSEDYLRFGRTRRLETITAMSHLGLDESNIIFLGFPDSGLKSMLTKNVLAETPFYSRYTKSSEVPYDDSYQGFVTYAGNILLAGLEEIIAGFQPDIIAYPNQGDKHPDHMAANLFVRAALSRLDYQPRQQLTYLVHHARWPAITKNSAKSSLLPPRKLANNEINWHALVMTPEQIEDKRAAMSEYKTQLPWLTLHSFIRKNELFAVY